jgi:hypothetical protein
VRARIRNVPDKPVEVFCAHDADASGTMIYQTLQEATKARGARKIKIINLGLEPWEAVAMGCEVETLEQASRLKAVADYISEHGGNWENWLRTSFGGMRMSLPLPNLAIFWSSHRISCGVVIAFSSTRWVCRATAARLW